MKYALPILMFLALAAFGCKHEYWTFVPGDEGETVAVVDKPEPEPEVKEPEVKEPEVKEPEVEPPTPKEIIFILGIDGMD